MDGVKFETVLNEAAVWCGIPSASLTDTQKEQLAQHITDATGEAWQYGFWPFLVKLEQRWWRDAWANGTTYAADDEVVYDGVYYVSQQSQSGNRPDDDDGTNWLTVSAQALADPDYVFVRKIAYNQAGQTPFGEDGVDLRNCLYSTDPHGGRTRWQSAPLDYCLRIEDGVLCQSSTVVDQPWFRYRPLAPEYTVTAYAAGTTYAAREVVYSGGYVYRSLQDGNVGQSVGTASYWERLDVPRIFRKYIRLKVKARWTTDKDLRPGFMAEAEEELIRLWDVVQHQQAGMGVEG